MSTTKSDRAGYRALERAALEDLAYRTLTDAKAPREHVRAARERLRATRIEDVQGEIRALTAAQVAALRRAIKSALGDGATVMQTVGDSRDS